MRSTSALLFATLALTAAAVTPAWAGSLGNGADQWNAYYGHNKASYSYCYGGNNHVEYFSHVFQVVPASRMGNGTGGAVEFAHYLTGMGYNNDGGQCHTTPTMASAVADKQGVESRFQSAEFHHRQVVETDWAGH